jgi:hypothetical protein
VRNHDLQNVVEQEQGMDKLALNLKYLGESRLEIRGAITGKLYSFSSVLPVRSVDLRDARHLLASPLFTIAQ